jgi:hypothetical protein
MDTSENARFVADVLLVAFVCVIGLANLRLAARLISRRKVERRSAIVWPALLLICILSIVSAFRWEPHWVQVTRHRVETTELEDGASLRIVQLTDLHLPDELGPREMRALRAVRSLRPDVIVLTGDYTNDRAPRVLRGLTRFAKSLSEVAPVYAVRGNWDNWQDIAALRGGGVTSLLGWTGLRCRGGEVTLGGVEWYRGEAGPIPASLRGRYRIVLCHMPCHFEKLAGRGADLVLAGHTHGGQVRLPVFGALLPDRRLVGKYQMGFHRHGGALMYVNRGLGCEGKAPQVRFFCRPEVALVEIVGTGGKKR